MDYQANEAATNGVAAGGAVSDDYTIAQMRKQYQDFATTKNEEIKEQRTARHYYHGDQLDTETRRTLKKRKQPEIIDNLVGRKIDGVVGVVEKLRQDPKAYPRTPKQQQGADTATAAVRYVADINELPAKRSEVARSSAINGIGGIEMFLEPGDHGDPDVGLALVDADCFFYDPRSFRHDFSDARYMGIAKWIDVEQAKLMFPDSAEELGQTMSQSGETAGLQQQDREQRWIDQTEKRVFVVEHWYVIGDEWHWCFYTGTIELARGTSPYFDEKGRTFCRFIMFSANVDHDGDRYGFVRNFKTLQDEVNARRSKGLHLLNTRRIVATRGMVDDVERARTEAARPDGFIEINPDPNGRFEFDDAAKQADLAGQIKFLEMTRQSIENFGPNPALLGQGIEKQSGRAIALLQQAAMSEIGPFLIAYRGWTIRLYRAVWNTVQRYWKAERWIRVTDNEGIAQFVQLNELALDQTGQPILQNALGNLDVDIILDEGPDVMNVMQDTLDTLQPLAQKGDLPAEVLIELMNIPGDMKKRLTEMIMQSRQGDPQRKAIENQNAVAEIQNTEADTAKKKAEAMKAMQSIRDIIVPQPDPSSYAPRNGAPQQAAGFA